MPTIYEIADKYKFIQQMIEEGTEPEVFTDVLNATDGELAEKLENYAMIMTNIQSNIDGKKAEAKRLLERAKAEEESIKRMKQNMQYAMVASGQTKVKGEKFNFTVQKNPPSLKVVDETLIPRKFVKVEQVSTVDKKAILAEAKNGVEIKGVEIQQGESIRIR